MKQIQMIRTPTGPLGLVRQVAEKLLAEGVIAGTLDGDLHAADAATVKAAILASAVCDFCSSPSASHHYDVPDFSIGALPGNYGAGRSTGGWMACDACDELICADKRDRLVDRAVTNMAFPKFSRHAVGELLAKFWQGMDERITAAGVGCALANYIDGTGPTPRVRATESDRDLRIAGVMKMTGLTRAEVDSMFDEIGGVDWGGTSNISRDVVAKLSDFKRRFGKVNDAAIDLLVKGPQKPLADVVPHWQRALDAKFQAYVMLAALVKESDNKIEHFRDPVDLNDGAAVLSLAKQAKARSALRDMGFAEDVKFLRAAQAYSFNAETVAAIREAARGIPHDTPLSAIETPNTGAGWFWFAEPLPVALPAALGRIVNDHLHALLWGWVDVRDMVKLTIDDEVVASAGPTHIDQLRRFVSRAGPSGEVAQEDVVELSRLLRQFGVSQALLDRKTWRSPADPALAFSAYVIDSRGQYVKKGSPSPSTRWHWPLSLSFHDMLAFNAQLWEESYGVGAPFERDAHVTGKDVTLHCVAELSLFFVMACLWFRQTVPVLTRASGHVERHARKRMVREHGLKEPPTVQVVALRKSQRVPAEDAPAERRDGAREYHCRWIVKGHPRLQPCGPGRKDKKLIWIEAHPAGPDDKPLRTREKVFAVIR